jgi:hypothetical protein
MNSTDFAVLLSELRNEVQDRIKGEISGSQNAGKRFLYDMITPIRLNIRADSQEYHLEFLPGGQVQLHNHLASNPDVTVKGELESLRDSILQRSSRVFEEAERSGRIAVTSQSWKGQQAMQKVKELFKSRS